MSDIFDQEAARVHRVGTPPVHLEYAQGGDWNQDPSKMLHEQLERSLKAISASHRKIVDDVKDLRRRKLKQGAKGARRMWLEILDTFRLL